MTLQVSFAMSLQMPEEPDMLWSSVIKKVMRLLQTFCINVFVSHAFLIAAIDLFNFNYDSAKSKAVSSFMPLFGSGSPAAESTDTVGTGVVVGCQNCYAYAGVTFKFR